MLVRALRVLRKIKLKKWIASTVAASLLFTAVAPPFVQASLWSERRKAVAAAKIEKGPIQLASAFGISPALSPQTIQQVLEKVKPQSQSRGQPPIQTGLLREIISRIERYGDIERAYFCAPPPTPRAVAMNQPLVVLIQDAHGIFGVQKNIAHLVKEITEMGAGWVGVEGSAGKMAGLEKWRKHPDKETVMGTAGYLLEKGLLTGVEVAGLASSPARDKNGVDFFGVEDKDKYLEQVQTFKDTLSDSAGVREWVVGVGRKIEELKEKNYTAELKELDKNKDLYEKGELKLGAWLEYLGGSNHTVPPTPRTLTYASIDKYLSAYKLEKEINFKKVSEDQKKLLAQISAKLNQKELTNLLEESLAYRFGKIGVREFYGGIEEKCMQADIQLPGELAKYIRYVAMVESIDREKLFIEIKELEGRAWNECAKKVLPEIRSLMGKDKDYRLLEKALDFKLSPEEWEEYVGRRKQIEELERVPSEVREVLRNVSRFNELSHARNRIFVNNLLSYSTTHDSQILVLVAGGYHSKGVEELLKNKKISYITIRPHMNAGEIEPASSAGRENYHPLNAFKKNVLPLEKMFLPEKVSLAPESNLGGMSPAVTDGEAIVDSTLKVVTQGMKQGKWEGDIFTAEVKSRGRTYKIWTPKRDDRALNREIVKNPEEILDVLKSFSKRKNERIEAGELWNIFDEAERKRGFAIALGKQGIAERLFVPVSKLIFQGAAPRLKRFVRNMAANSLASFGRLGIGGGGEGGLSDNRKTVVGGKVWLTPENSGKVTAVTDDYVEVEFKKGDGSFQIWIKPHVAEKVLKRSKPRSKNKVLTPNLRSKIEELLEEIFPASLSKELLTFLRDPQMQSAFVALLPKNTDQLEAAELLDFVKFFNDFRIAHSWDRAYHGTTSHRLDNIVFQSNGAIDYTQRFPHQIYDSDGNFFTNDHGYATLAGKRHLQMDFKAGDAKPSKEVVVEFDLKKLLFRGGQFFIHEKRDGRFEEIYTHTPISLNTLTLESKLRVFGILSGLRNVELRKKIYRAFGYGDSLLVGMFEVVEDFKAAVKNAKSDEEVDLNLAMMKVNVMLLSDNLASSSIDEMNQIAKLFDSLIDYLLAYGYTIRKKDEQVLAFDLFKVVDHVVEETDQGRADIFYV